MSLTAKVLLGLVLGLAGGVFLAPAESGAPATIVAWIEPVGALWVNAIRMTVIPLVGSLLVVGIVGTDVRAVGRIGTRAIGLFPGRPARGRAPSWRSMILANLTNLETPRTCLAHFFARLDVRPKLTARSRWN
mgnify:CR=1 FL=1